MPSFHNDLLLRLLTSLVVGALIGTEREYRSKSAGLRTFTLICLGSTLFTILSDTLEVGHSGRIAANIVTGIGFLGAGVIFKADERVQGLTTAAIIWVTAALGMAIGAGHLRLSLLATPLVLLVMGGFIRLERLLERFRQSRRYRIVYRYSPENFKEYRKLFRGIEVVATRGRQSVGGGLITGYWTIRGQPKEHERLIKTLLANANVVEFDF